MPDPSPATASASAPAPVASPVASPPAPPSASPAVESASESFPQIRTTRIPAKIMDAFRAKAKAGGREMSNRPGAFEEPKTDETKTGTADDAGDSPKSAEEQSKVEADNVAETDGEGAPPEEVAETPRTGDEAAAPAAKPSKKLSPWRLVDQYKERVKALETELAASKTASPKPGEPDKAFTERLTAAEKRAAELEDEIRFVNYQKSGEFQEQYQRPYEAAWSRAVKDLNEISVTDAAGNARAATAEDMLTLVNLPLGKAREVADSMFGAFANDAMAHRKAIKELFDKQQEALSGARAKAAEWEKTRAAEAEKARTDIDRQVGETWTKANADAVTDAKYGKYFVPRESDPEWNQRLAKGFELVDKAFADANPRDPRLSPEQRRSVIERHAAIRNRAAAFGPLRFENERLTARVGELEKELAEYKKTEPAQGGGGSKPPAQNGATDPMDRFREALRKRAQPRML